MRRGEIRVRYDGDSRRGGFRELRSLTDHGLVDHRLPRGDMPVGIELDHQRGATFRARDGPANERAVANPESRAAVGTGAVAERHEGNSRDGGIRRSEEFA